MQGVIRGLSIKHLINKLRNHLEGLHRSTSPPITVDWVRKNIPLKWTDEQLEQFLLQQAQLIQEAIRNAPPLPFPLVVYRGMRNDDLQASLRDVDLDLLSYRLTGFCSTSLEKRVSSNDFFNGRCCIFEILLPASTRAIYIQEFDEEEVLLDMNSIFVQTQEHTNQYHVRSGTRMFIGKTTPWVHLPKTP